MIFTTFLSSVLLMTIVASSAYASLLASCEAKVTPSRHAGFVIFISTQVEDVGGEDVSLMYSLLQADFFLHVPLEQKVGPSFPEE